MLDPRKKKDKKKKEKKKSHSAALTLSGTSPRAGLHRILAKVPTRSHGPSFEG